ncbi:MAG: hypothetical protein WC527_04720 [Candidatus Margulisiibacteriota bacterium]
MNALQRINIGRISFHNPFAPQRSKAGDPLINTFTLARLSFSRDKDVRKICVENLRDRLERATIRPFSLQLFNERVAARAISYSHLDKMPHNRRADRSYSGVVGFINNCSSDSLKLMAARAEDVHLMGMIALARIPEDLGGLSAFAIIGMSNNPYAKVAFQRILAFWPDLDDGSLSLFVEKAARKEVKEAAAEELRRRSGV